MSSYEQNNFGEVITAHITSFKPVNCVELGVLDGYSTLSIARGLLENGHGYLNAYDLFEDYPFKHGMKTEVEKKIKDLGIPRGSVAVYIHKLDAYEAHNQYANNTVHFLHVDISNTGETVRRIMESWDPKMVQGGIILFEGGTEERDQVDWMIRYNKNPIINEKYVYGTYLDFPGITVLLKKRD